MRHAAVVLCLLVGGTTAAWALGHRWPWLSKTMLEPCGRCELEWRLAQNAIRRDPPVDLKPDFLLQELRGEPRPEGLLVFARVALGPQARLTPGAAEWQSHLDDASRQAAALAAERFGVLDREHLMVALYLGEDLVWTRGYRFARYLPQDAPVEQEQAALHALLRAAR